MPVSVVLTKASHKAASKAAAKPAPKPTPKADAHKPAPTFAPKPTSPQPSMQVQFSAAGLLAAAASAPQPSAVSDAAFVSTGTAVVVDIQASDSGYDNNIYYTTDDWKTKTAIGIDNRIVSVNLGTFAAGTQIQFGIDNGNGQFFRAGAASTNADGVVHANTTRDAQGGLRLGFEDLFGGGDRDFNDAIIVVRSAPAPTAVAPPPAPPTPSAGPSAPAAGSNPAASTKPPHDNRSGLGDGTNPGLGDGRANSPNTGTLNPAGVAQPAKTTSAKAKSSKPAAVPKAKAAAPAGPAAAPKAPVPSNPAAAPQNTQLAQGAELVRQAMLQAYLVNQSAGDARKAASMTQVAAK